MATVLPSFIVEPAEVYHKKSKDFLSSHQLGDFRKCPRLYQQKRLGLLESVDRPAYLLGRAVHTLTLEGLDRLEAEYAVGGPINPRTQQPYGTATKAFAQWAAAHGKPVLTDDQFELVAAMCRSVRTHETAMELLEDGIAEGVVRAEYCGVDCQIRIDWFNPERGIVDLKTCDDLTWFEADARRYGYAYQLAFYRSVLARHTGEKFPVHLIAVEKKDPLRCGVWRVDTQSLDQAQRENEAAIGRLKHCMDTDTWSTGYEETRVLDAL